MGVFKELQKRDLIAQMTDPEKIENLLENEKITFYIGFDPTADSLHVGHFLQMVIMAHMQRAGHRPIAIMGGGTGMIGDPSGRSDMRNMLTKEQIDYNISRFKQQMSKFIDFSDNKAMIINNGDWLLNLNYIDFLREVGPHFTVNRMLAAECYKSRMESGLSFLEFNYMIMQSYDFYVLNKQQNCVMQMGGDDQWSNILGGIELIRRKEHKEAYGITFRLLTTSDGKKMGKTQKGAVWLDPEKTSPYEFFQYWRNVEDTDVVKCLRMLTFLPLEEIDRLSQLEGSQINQAKEILAFELTKMVHSEEDANKALEAARALFSAGSDSSNMPMTELEPELLTDGGIGILDLLTATKLAPSKSEARRLVLQGGIVVDNEKIEKPEVRIGLDQLKGGIVVKKGKKTFHKVFLK
jgi:tyrosyl-tRNA synthetase